MARRGQKNCDEAIILALAAGASASAAAEQAKCCEKTVRRRMADPAFKGKVEAMRTEMIRRAVGRLAALGTASVDELYKLLHHAKAEVRLGAIKTALSTLFKGASIDLLAKQVQELRDEIQGGKGIKLWDSKEKSTS